MREDVVAAKNRQMAAVEWERPASLPEKTLLFLVMAVVIVFDHLTKLYIEVWLPLNTSLQPWPDMGHLFQFTHVSNTGAAFGLFPTSSKVFMIVAILVAAIIIVYNYRLPAGHFLFRIALGLQLGGALGNLVDRIRLGHVTDFLDFGPWPVFNLADTSIVAGVVILAYLMLLEQQQANADKQLEQTRAQAASQEGRPSDDLDPRLEEPDMLWNE
jgi:signal peptidase II